MKQRWVILVVSACVIITVLAIGLSVYVYGKYERTARLLVNPALATQEEVASLTRVIGQCMELPTGETPTLATVSDIEQLKVQ